MRRRSDPVAAEPVDDWPPELRWPHLVEDWTTERERVEQPESCVAIAYCRARDARLAWARERGLDWRKLPGKGRPVWREELRG